MMPFRPVNAVYYPSWKVYKGKPPSCLDVSVVTHVFYAFVRINEDGTFRLLDEFGDLKKNVDGEQGCLAALAKLKRENPHLKTLVSVGGGSGSAEFPILAANPAARETFGREAKRFCDCYGFDGIDIDWEHPQQCTEGEDFVRLVQAARRAMPSPEYLITAALPVGEYCLKHIDLKLAGELLDYLNIMGYDFTGGWTDVSGHQAQLLPPGRDINKVYPTLRKSGSGGVEYALSKGFPSRKILLGVPAYARYFPQARGPGQPFSNAGEMEYCDMPAEWVQSAVVNRDIAAASYVDSEGDRGFVSFDVPETVTAKSQYALSNRLGGLFYWTAVGDRCGDHSLVAAGYRGLMAHHGGGAHGEL